MHFTKCVLPFFLSNQKSRETEACSKVIGQSRYSQAESVYRDDLSPDLTVMELPIQPTVGKLTSSQGC